ncbi:MAG: hypothetical protein C4527_11165 [Candidatus Omnitrophota bacterium]|jgi:hypothetical protein|nr:MAG: hypothetical protein C4527_11165 [Candidatus Omnitrophota bacterium]
MTPIFQMLRKNHPRFTYENFSWKREEGKLSISFHFVLEPDIHFHPRIEMVADSESFCLPSPAILDRLIFHLGLIELLSYWKAACSPEILIKPTPFPPQTSTFFRELFYGGMGEYFFMNQIDFKDPDLMHLRTASSGSDTAFEAFHREPLSRRPLLMISGGKDSALSAGILNELGVNFNAMILNPTESARRIAELAGCRSPIVIRREICPQLLQLNEMGYLNGHTPFSALLGMLGIIGCAAFGYDFAIASNEAGCNTPYVRYLDKDINHQYSKSYPFEHLFNRYVRSHLISNVEYFSLLRPLREIQVVGCFSNHTHLLRHFRSCNKQQKQDAWCLRCAKCIAVYTLFYPFLTSSEMTEIFGGHVSDDRANVEILLQIMGEKGHRPFECIATKEEMSVALHLAVSKHRCERTPLPPLLQYAERELLAKYPVSTSDLESILFSWNEEHLLPTEWAVFLKRRVMETMHNQIARLMDDER